MYNAYYFDEMDHLGDMLKLFFSIYADTVLEYSAEDEA
jgi:hypothetical protein